MTFSDNKSLINHYPWIRILKGQQAARAPASCHSGSGRDCAFGLTHIVGAEWGSGRGGGEREAY